MRSPPSRRLCPRLPCGEMDLAADDRRFLWHPFTQQQGWAEEDAPIIERAERCELIDVEGRHYIDGVSSLWCNVHGHRHPAIDIAVRDQMDRVSHSTMLGLSHRQDRKSTRLNSSYVSIS